jgi:hypothetical protein
MPKLVIREVEVLRFLVESIGGLLNSFATALEKLAELLAEGVYSPGDNAQDENLQHALETYTATILHTTLNKLYLGDGGTLFRSFIPHQNLQPEIRNDSMQSCSGLASMIVRCGLSKRKSTR